MTGRRAENVGLRAQGSVNGHAGAPIASATSATRSDDLPRDLPRRVLPLKGKNGTAEYLGVSVRSVWRLVDAGHLHPVRLPGLRRVGFDVRELDALIEASRD
jgi:excisionase family DNA binding protein